ncbi:amidase [Austwickia chelonae]|uniref:Putative amidase n=1 Tax=Austwickia chelonae NBRC 105200 TaxID=1184607 RepID=K6WBP0_9MICO|nr:amidase [Austwickia chelonae]GAB79247.1 putative amidase [Austwickia chelonae NBRC 105200]SEW37575.1 amidase [Austwickia chelonae]
MSPPSAGRPTTPDISELGALELAAALRRHELTATDVARRTLEQISRHNDRIGAFVHVDEQHTLEQAQAADDLLREHRKRQDADPARLPPLLGVPCPVKDLTPVAGMPCTFGSAAMTGFVPDSDDGVVRRLRRAGALVIGKTTTPEFGFPCYTEPDIAPPARTPWDLNRSAGGSSGGAAAAVAAGLVPIAHGSDGGGSLRIPASACGLVGMKASRGLISPGPSNVDGPGLATHGVLTRTVRDTALAFDLLRVGWPGDVYRMPAPRTTYLDACERLPGSLRIGVLTEPVIADCEVHPGPLRAVERAAALLRDLGHRVVRAPRPFPRERWAAFSAIWSVLALSVPLPPGGEERLVPLTRWLRGCGREVSGADYAAALASTQQLAREVARSWSDFDVVLTPTLARPPAPIGALRNDRDPAADFADQCAFTPWTSIYNLSGRPAVSLPVHRECEDGVELPYGVMLGAGLGEDELLLSLAAQVEAADPWPGPVTPGRGGSR